MGNVKFPPRAAKRVLAGPERRQEVDRDCEKQSYAESGGVSAVGGPHISLSDQ